METKSTRRWVAIHFCPNGSILQRASSVEAFPVDVVQAGFDHLEEGVVLAAALGDVLGGVAARVHRDGIDVGVQEEELQRCGVVGARAHQVQGCLVAFALGVDVHALGHQGGGAFDVVPATRRVQRLPAFVRFAVCSSSHA